MFDVWYLMMNISADQLPGKARKRQLTTAGAVLVITAPEICKTQPFSFNG